MLKERQTLSRKAPYITTADARKLDIHNHVMRIFQFWDRPVFELDLMDPFEDKGEVLGRQKTVSLFLPLINLVHPTYLGVCAHCEGL